MRIRFEGIEWKKEKEIERAIKATTALTHLEFFFMSFAKYVSVWFFVIFSLTFVLFTHAFHKCWYSRYMNFFFHYLSWIFFMLKTFLLWISKKHSINNRFWWVSSMLEMNNKTLSFFFLKIICPFFPHNTRRNNSEENTNKWSWSFPDFIYHPKCICSHHMLW